MVLIFSAYSQQGGQEEDFDVRIIGGTITIINYTGKNKDVIIPSQIGNMPVAAIGDNAFKEKEITSIIIPDSVTAIGDYAFQNNSISKITIPDSVTEIGYEAFGGNWLEGGVTIGANVSLGGGRMHGFSVSQGFDFRYYRMGLTRGFYWPMGEDDDGSEFWGGPR